jgi:Cu/Zn superoxide dismutase
LRRITKAALGGLAGCALVLCGTQAASGALSNILKIQGEANDVNTSTVALDSARAKITIKEGEGRTSFSIRVTGIEGVVPGTELGSHLHTGKCVDRDYGDPLADPPKAPGSQAGPHYNDEVVVGGKSFPGPDVLDPAVVSDQTEVWFRLMPDSEGMAYDETTVPFVPVDPDGDMAIVVHLLATNTTNGTAGARQACFPVNVPQWIPEEPSPSPSPTE